MPLPAQVRRERRQAENLRLGRSTRSYTRQGSVAVVPVPVPDQDPFEGIEIDDDNDTDNADNAADISPLAFLAEELHALEDHCGGVELSTLNDTEKLKIAEVLTGLQEVRRRLLGPARLKTYREAANVAMFGNVSVHYSSDRDTSTDGTKGASGGNT